MTEGERNMLLLESRFYRAPGAKEQAISTELGMTPTRYYQLLGRLIDRQDAEVEFPLLVHRLRRVGAQRARGRAARRGLG